MTVLLTGYEPFGEHDENPSQEVATDLNGQTVAGHEVVGRVLPVEYDVAGKRIVELIEEYDPDVVVSTGLAGGRSSVCLGRVGINVNDCVTVPDNAGVEPHNEPIKEDGNDAYFSTLPVVDIVESLLDSGVPSRVSNTAGTHLCNNALYSTRDYVESNSLKILSGFVHLPYLPRQAVRKARENRSESAGSVPPSMPQSLQTKAVKRVIALSTEHRQN